MEVTEYSPGTMCWIELGTTDQDGAKEFYSSLFGWAVDDSPLGPGSVYTTFRIRGKGAAAAYTMGEDEANLPPHWNSYVAVENVDKSAEVATTNGGTALSDPFDVMEFGRMAVIQDPTGAVIRLWQAGTSIGAEVVNEPGALLWSQVVTTDVPAAAGFYNALFGWTAKEQRFGDVDYTTFLQGDGPAAGAMAMPAGAEAAPHWQVTFAVEDAFASADRVKELGGGVFLEPRDSEFGPYGYVHDPQGAAFGINSFGDSQGAGR